MGDHRALGKQLPGCPGRDHRPRSFRGSERLHSVRLPGSRAESNRPRQTARTHPVSRSEDAMVNMKTRAGSGPANIEDIYELSPMQQGLLFHTLRDPSSGTYLEQVVYAVHALDAAAFRKTWQWVIDRHAALRTSFHWEDLEKPVQVVHRHVAIPLEEHDWHGLPLAEQEDRLQTFLKEDRQRDFDLMKPPLMRLVLIRQSAEVHWFIWSRHHLLMDGWSGPILFKELTAAYDALCQGQNLVLPAPRPFRNYIAWLRRQDLAKAETYWRQALKGFTAPTPLVVDRNANGLPDRDRPPREQSLRLSAELTAAIQTLARQQQVTLNTVLQAAWALLLSRYSGQDDVLFGTTVSGRPPAIQAIESMVGLFITTLPVRVRVPAALAAAAWLKRLQAQQSEWQQYEYSSLVHVHGWSAIPRDMPLFESVLVFENLATENAGRKQPGNLDTRPPRRPLQQTGYPLCVIARPGPA